jgi:hypothetical protein
MTVSTLEDGNNLINDRPEVIETADDDWQSGIDDFA